MTAGLYTFHSLLCAAKVIKISFIEVAQEFCGELKYEHDLTTFVLDSFTFQKSWALWPLKG